MINLHMSSSSGAVVCLLTVLNAQNHNDTNIFSNTKNKYLNRVIEVYKNR